jgi:hypothetical protein
MHCEFFSRKNSSTHQLTKIRNVYWILGQAPVSLQDDLFGSKLTGESIGIWVMDIGEHEITFNKGTYDY